MFVSQLQIFPVKSLAGTAPDHAQVEPCGLRHDRRWMVVDAAGHFLSQRSVPQMATVRVAITQAGVSLSLADAGGIEVPVPGTGAARLDVTVWRDSLHATLADEPAHDWISRALRQPCRLVHMHDTAARPINRAFGCSDETVSFADGYPVLLTSPASLADLNARLAHPIPIGRFRGNIVVAGAPAWAEDTWRKVRIGGAIFRVVKPCERCIVTTVDQVTGERPDRAEPLRTLGTFRRDERGLMFGQNLIPEQLGRVAVGDAVEVLEAGPPNVVPLA